MNIKLNNNDEAPSSDHLDDVVYTSAEERRRTGRIIAIIVGISLVCLAMYHAWVRNVPVLASLLVPALIMLLYIAWVLYTASKDKRKEDDAEAGVIVENQLQTAVASPEPVQEPKQRTIQEKKPVQVQEKKPAPVQEKKPTQSQEKKPAQVQEKKLVQDREKKPSQVQEKIPSPKTFRRSYSIA